MGRTTRLAVDSLDDRITPTATLVSANLAGTDAGNAGSGVTDVSADGRFVVFQSNASNLTADLDANNTTDLFVRDTTLNATVLVTKTVGGGAGGGRTGGRISADGRYVVWGGDPRGNIGNFMTSPFATDGKLNPMENGGGHVYRTDLQTGQTVVVDISPSTGISGKGGFGAGGLNGTLDVSDDGNVVAFTYVGHDLLPGDAPTSNVDFDLYVRDIAAGTTKLVNHTPGGGFSAVTAFNQDLVVSGNGKTVLFETTATDLVTQTDTNAVNDLFAYDVATGNVRLVSVTADGTTAAGGGAIDGRFRADIDAGGNLVTLAVNNAAPEVVAGASTGDPFSGDLYLRDLAAGKTTLVTRSPATGKAAAAFLAGAGTGAAVNDISADGKYIATLGSVGLIPGDTFAFASVLYVYEVATGRFASATDGPDGTRLDVAGTGTISADGRYVSFVGNGGFAAGVTFVPGAANTGTAYVYDRLADRTFAVATDAAGATAFGNNGFGNDLTPLLSADGKKVAFSNSEALGGATDTNNLGDVYVNDVPLVAPLVATPAVALGKSQANPATTGPLTFTVAFNGQVSGFDASDITFAGSTVGGTLKATVTGDNRTFTVTVTGMTGKGDVAVSIGAGAALAPDGSASLAAGPATVAFNDGTATNAPPTISDVTNQSTAAGTAVGPLTFTVGDAETAADKLTVTAASSNATLLPAGNVTFGGSGASRTVTVTPAAGQTGTATVTLTVADAGGLTATDTFVVTVNAAGANAPPTISDVANQSTAAGKAVGPLAFTVGDAETAADKLTVTALSSDTTLVPTANVTIGGSGANRTVTVTPAAGRTGTATVTLTVTDAGGKTATDTFAVAVAAGTTSPLLVGVPQFAAGTDAGGNGSVVFFNPDKSVRFTVQPFGTFTGGVRTASADFNGDGVADVVAGTGPGRATRVVVLDGAAQKELFAVDPFEASFGGGVYVTAGDLNGDGVPDLVITPDEGGGPRVDIYSGKGFGKFASFFGIDDPNFRGGARAAIGDVTGDGVGDLIVVAGFGGGPRVAGFDGTSLAGTPRHIFGDFFIFETALRNGVFITAGDIDGDGKADIIAGGGPGGGPRVFALSGAGLVNGNRQTQLANFFGGNADSRGGIRVSVKNLDADGKADLVVGSGGGSGSRLTAYFGNAIAAAGVPATALDFDVFPGFAGGVFVG